MQQQRISINGSFSDWNEVITGVPEGSILGSLLFNIFLNDIFVFISKCNLCNYADDNNTLYSTGKDLNRIRRKLEIDFMILHQWFHENHMTLNPRNHYMVIGSEDLSNEIMLNNSKITSTNEDR